MNIKLLTALAIALPLFTVACAKKEAPAEEATPAEATAPVDETVTAEQQAAIDSVDQPNPEAIAVEGEEPTASVETTETVTTHQQRLKKLILQHKLSKAQKLHNN